jgi:hypothetical protein
MDKLLLEVNKRKLLDEWEKRGHLKNLLNFYMSNPEEIIGKIIINGEFKLDFHSIWVNIGQVPLKCFTEESQQLLKKDERLANYIDHDVEKEGFVTAHKDKIVSRKGEKNISVIIQLY